jgi:hypothetical protein
VDSPGSYFLFIQSVWQVSLMCVSLFQCDSCQRSKMSWCGPLFWSLHLIWSWYWVHGCQHYIKRFTVYLIMTVSVSYYYSHH